MEKPTRAYAPYFKYPPDDNPTGDIFHAEVTKVDFIRVDNFLASSQVASVFEDPYRDKRLIMEPNRDKHLEYCHEETQDLSSERSNFGIVRRLLFLLEDHKEEGMEELD
jgi:hypothetical protein